MSFVGGIAQGVGQGFKNQAQGEMDREKINGIKAEAEHRRQMRPLEMQQAKGQVEQQGMQINQLKQQLLKQDQKMVQDESYRYIDSYLNSGELSQDGALDDRYLNSAYVENPLLNQSMSKRLGMKQITGITNDGTGNLVFKDSMSGQEKQIPLATFLPSIGYFNKRDTVHNEKAEELYKKNKQFWEINKLKSETGKNVALTNKANRPESSGSGGLSIKDQLYIEEKMLSIANKTSDLNTSNNVKAVDKEAGKGNHAGVYNMVTNSTKLYQEMFPTAADKNQVKDGRTALRLGVGLKDLQKDLDKAIDNDQVGGIPNMMISYLGKYGIGTKDSVSKAALAEALTTGGEALTADQLKLITGAAFNETEMMVKLKPLIGAMQGYDGSKVAKSKFKEAVNQWDRTASNYISTLPKSYQSYVKGSLLSKPKPKGDNKDTYSFGGKEYKVGTTQKTKSGKTATLQADGKWVTK